MISTHGPMDSMHKTGLQGFRSVRLTPNHRPEACVKSREDRPRPATGQIEKIEALWAAVGGITHYQGLVVPPQRRAP